MPAMHSNARPVAISTWPRVTELPVREKVSPGSVTNVCAFTVL